MVEDAFDRLEDRCTLVLDLISHFDQRAIREQTEWATRIYPKLKCFLSAAARDNEFLRLVLDAHITLAFAAGSVLDIKSGRHVELEQRTSHRRIWHSDDMEPDASWPSSTFDHEVVNEDGTDMAVAVSLTHDVAPEVRTLSHGTRRRLASCSSRDPHVIPGQGQSPAVVTHSSWLRRLHYDQCQRGTGKAPLHLFISRPECVHILLGATAAELGTG